MYAYGQRTKNAPLGDYWRAGVDITAIAPILVQREGLESPETEASPH